MNSESSCTNFDIENTWFRACRNNPEKKMYLFKSAEDSFDSLTGNMLINRVKRLGSYLQEIGESQEKVLLCLPQGLEYIYSFTACLYANLIAVPMNVTEFLPDQDVIGRIEPIKKDANSHIILTNSYFKNMLASKKEFSGCHIVAAEEVTTYDLEPRKERETDPAEIAVLLYTSGSTSIPKGVMLSHEALLSQAKAGADQWGITSESVVVSWMPLFHNFGLHFNFLTPLIQGAESILLSSGVFLKEPAEWLKICSEYRVTHMGAPNFAFDYCNREIDKKQVEGLSLRTLKAIICGGEPVSEQTYKSFIHKFESLGLCEDMFCPHYGLSETGAITTKRAGCQNSTLFLDREELEAGRVEYAKIPKNSKSVVSCGEVNGNTQLQIVDPDSLEQSGPQKIGELWVKSKSVSCGYLNRKEETKEVFLSGFFRTGDLGFVEDNQLYVVGRRKEVIIINGKNHYPVDIEWTVQNNVLRLKLPIAVFSYEAAKTEKVVIIQETEEGLGDSDYGEIIQDIIKTVSEHHKLFLHEIQLIKKGGIPKTASGKIQRNQCCKAFLSGMLPVLYTYKNEAFSSDSDEKQNNAWDSIKESFIYEVLAPVLQVETKKIACVSQLSELGLDSIQYVKLAKKIETVYSLDFDPVLLFQYSSIEKLADYLSGRIDIKESVSGQTLPSMDIAVIGISCKLPGAQNSNEYWDNLLEEIDSVTPIASSRPQILDHYAKCGGKQPDSFPKWGGFLKDVDKFDYRFFGISPIEAQSMDPQQRKLLELTWNVIEDSGYCPEDLKGKRVGIFAGVHNNDYADLVSMRPDLLDTYGAYLDSGLHMSMIANRVSRWFDFSGPSEIVNTACSSSLVAVNHAVESLRRGDSSLAIASGINLLLASRIYRTDQKAGMLSPDGRCKTFDNKADGFVRSEGMGAVLLKPYDLAVKDKDSIYGIIKGAVVNHDGHSNSLRAPNLNAQKELIKEAFRKTGLAPGSVSYIETHGTGTALGDPIEIKALQEAFMELDPNLNKGFCGLGSVKTYIGHCESASGIAGFIKIMLAMKHKILPGLLHFKTLNQHINLKESPFYIAQKQEAWKEPIRRAGISSFGFGGANAHILTEEYQELRWEKDSGRPDEAGRIAFIPVSAGTKEALYSIIKELVIFLQQSVQKAESGDFTYSVDLFDLAYTLQVGRKLMEKRILFLAENIGEVIQKLTDFLQGKKKIRDFWTENSRDDEIKRNRADQKNFKIAWLWLTGGKTDWQLIYNGKTPNRIHLTGYQFDKLHCWITKENRKEEFSKNFKLPYLHPLLHQNSSDFFEQRFCSVFTGEEFYLRDHVIRGRKTLSAAACLEMAGEAFRLSLGERMGKDSILCVEEAVFIRPICEETGQLSVKEKHFHDPDLYARCSGQRGVSVNLVFRVLDGEVFGYEIQDDGKEAGREPVIYGMGRIKMIHGEVESPLDIEGLKKECGKGSLSSKQCYEAFGKTGIQYGPSHQGIEELYQGEGMVLAKLVLPAGAEDTKDQFFLHPALLDSALQASMGMQDVENPQELLPYGIKEMYCYRRIGPVMWVFIQKSPGKQEKGLWNLELCLCDEAGEAAVRIKGLLLKGQREESPGVEIAEEENAEEEAAGIKAGSRDREQLRKEVVRYLKNLLSGAIRMPADQIDEEIQMERYGIDSILMMQLTDQLEKTFGPLSKTLFFEYQTIGMLAEYFMDEYWDQLAQMFLVKTDHTKITKEGTVLGKMNLQRQIKQNDNRKQEKVVSPQGETEEIAVIGLSGRYPGAENMDEFWKLLKDGIDCITEIPGDRWESDRFFDVQKGKPGKSYSKWGGFIKDIDCFDPLFFHITPKEAEGMDPQERLFLECAYEAIEDAGYTRKTLGLGKRSREVGVFAGVMYDEYQLYGAKETAAGRTDAIQGNVASIANRVSYFCNFNGPCMTVGTMCSSSLTALHLACKSLQRKECSVAVAGGVNLTVHPNKYLLLSQGRFVSSKGRCESFGKGGDGYVPGEGVGVVLLKPLSEARKDRDQIYGVIKATAINHGGTTNGYTVPDPNAQAEVIEKAVKESRITSRAISYIEAHGTGTSLGDPIEIRGLTKAFRKDTGENGYCAVGSVKSNIGHCESAAGMAGLAKILLQMKYKKLVPSLHSEELNSNIDFENTPFRVQQKLEDWERPILEEGGERKEYPRIAGLSSFGAGGSNAHVIIEEYRREEENVFRVSSGTGEKEIIVLSAKNEERLGEQCRRLIKEIEENREEKSLREIAYTLKVGREEMEERLAVVVESTKELAERLKAYLCGEKTEELFRGSIKNGKDTILSVIADEDMEQTIELWVEKKKWDKLLTLWVNGYRVNWAGFYKEPLPNRISLPCYPFAKEHYWVDRKSNSSDNLHPLVHQNRSDFFEQRFRSVFTGEEFYLRDHVIRGRKTLSAAACLEMAGEAFRLSMGQRMGEDRILCLEEAVFIRPICEETGQLCVNLVFGVPDGEVFRYEIQDDGKEAGRTPVIYGKGRIKMIPGEAESPLDIEGLKKECGKGSLHPKQCYEAFRKTGIQYGPSHQGIEELYQGEGKVLAKLVLPAGAEDAKNRFFLHPALLDSALQASMGMQDVENPQELLPYGVKEMYCYRRMQPVMWVYIQKSPGNQEKGLSSLELCLCDEAGEAAVRIKGLLLRSRREESLGVRLFERHWREEKEEEEEQKEYGHHMVFLCEPKPGIREEIENRVKGAVCIELVGENQGTRYEDCVIKMLEEIRGILESKPRKKVLVQLVIPVSQPLYRGLMPLLKTAGKENPALVGQLLETDREEDARAVSEVLWESRSRKEGAIRYEKGKRYQAEWKEEAVNTRGRMPWKEGGVYLITGGAGGLGLILAKEIAEQAKNPVIILTGRSRLTEEKERKLEELKELGAEVSYECCDLTDREETKELIRGLKERYKGINGILHSAGVKRDSFLIKKTEEEIREVLAPKVAGTINLDEASQDLELEFMIYFSSIAGAVGNEGQADYAAANGFLDSYAGYRNRLAGEKKRRGKTQSISWPLWKEGGMRAGKELESRMEEKGSKGLETREGLDALYRCMESGKESLLVMKGEPKRLEEILGKESRVEPKEHVMEEAVKTKAGCRDREQQEKETVRYLKEVLSGVTRMPVYRIDEETPLERYGIDSVMILKLTDELEKTFGPVSKTLFFEYQTINKLSDYFIDLYGNRVLSLLGIVAENQETGGKKKESLCDTEISKSRFAREESSRMDGFYENAEDIAVIGLSGRYPGAENMEEFWKLLKDGVDCITEIPRERWEYERFFDVQKGKPGKSYSKWGGFIKDIDCFDPLFFHISPKEAESMDPQERLFLECAYEAIEDAGYTRETLGRRKNRREVGVFAGVMYDEYQLYGVKQTEAERTDAIPGNVASIANRVSYICDFNGPCMTVGTMCSSSLTALHLACKSLQRRECSVAVAGGVNLTVHPNKYLLLSQSRFVSSKGRCESFGKGGDGYVPGEGVGVVLLKPLSEARKDRDQIYGVIKATAINHGGKTNGYTVPDPNAQAEVIEKAVRESRITSRAISYIEAHGTGTSLGDPIEIRGLTKAFRKDTGENGYCAVGSVKSNIGHCESAAGMAGLAKILLQMKYKKLVPSLHSEELNSNIDFENTPFRVQQKLEDWERPILEEGGERKEYPRIAGLSSFGAGGSNAHVIIEEYRREEESVFRVSSGTGEKEIIVLSAKNEERLGEQCRRLIKEIEENGEEKSFREIAYTLKVGREEMEERLAVVAESAKELVERLKGYLQGEEAAGGMFHGCIRQGEEDAVSFSADEELDRTIGAWAEKGDLDKIAKLWTDGFRINWDLIYKGNHPGRISLPTYPFAKRHCWVMKQPMEALEEVIENEDERNQVPEIKREDRENVKLTEVELQDIISASLCLKPEDIDINTSFFDLGVDSITGVQLVEKINRKWGTALSVSKLYDYTTIQDLIRYLNSEVEEAPDKNFVKNELIKILADILCLDTDEIGEFESFSQMGVDSIMGMQWIERINKRFHTTIAATKIYDYPNIHEFSLFLEKQECGNEAMDPLDGIIHDVQQGTMDIDEALKLLHP